MSKNIVIYDVDLDNLPELTKNQKKQMDALALMKESDIDYSDIPPSTEEELKKAMPRRLYKPVKSTTTVRVDTDILEWLKSYGRGYQTRINTILRDAMLRSMQAQKV